MFEPVLEPGPGGTPVAMPSPCDLRARPEIARRTLVLAPHPDDDTLSAGSLIHWAVRAAADVRVIYMTDGDDNQWSQRRVERRVRIGASGRRRWGARRRREAAESLKRLGVPVANATWLGLPDQRLDATLINAPQALVGPIARAIESFAPTLLLVPALDDLHPDHGAVSIAALAALATVPPAMRPLALGYLIHDPGHPGRVADEWRFTPRAGEIEAKRHALSAHESQLAWHRRAFLGMAERDEGYTSDFVGTVSAAAPSLHATHHEDERNWSLDLPLGHWPVLGGLELYAIALAGAHLCATHVRLRRSRTVSVACAPGEGHGTLHARWTPRRLHVDWTGAPAGEPVRWFVRVRLPFEQRLGFLGRWPWLTLPLAAPVEACVPACACAGQAPAPAAAPALREPLPLPRPRSAGARAAALAGVRDDARD